MSVNKSHIVSVNDSDKDSVNYENCWVNNFMTFKNCSPEIKQELINNTKTKEYSKGEYLIKIGEAESGVFFIQSGKVKISKKGYGKKEFILWVAESGDLVGLNSFIDNEAFSYSAIAIDPVKACFILSSDLKKILQKEPLLSAHLIKNLCEKLNTIEHRITNISGKKIREQCAELLISIASKHDRLDKKNFIIDYSINDMAGFIGTTKNYLYKILTEFTNKKILLVHNRKLIVNNIEALSLIAKGNDKQNLS